MNDTHGAEEMLRGTLQAKAAEARDVLSIADVRRSAGATRSRSRLHRSALAAAAVGVVVGGSALLLRPEAHEPAPAPSTSPTATVTTGPSPSPTPDSSSGGQALRRIPQGRPSGITWMHAGTVHLAGGGTTTFSHRNLPFTGFTSYHGGWLAGIGSGADRVRWYDNTGVQRSDGPGLGLFAVSEDGTRTAYAQSGSIHIGSTSGMGNSEQSVPASDQSWPIGFLRNGDLVYQTGSDTVAVSNGSTVAGMTIGYAVSAADDLIAGEDAQGRTLVVSGNGSVVWTSETWSVGSFSPDGRYAAATNMSATPGPGGFAILDARTGTVVAEHDDLPAGDALGGRPVFDQDGSLLVAASSGNLDQTILRLDRDGTVTRASEVFPLASSSDMESILFATRP